MTRLRTGKQGADLYHELSAESARALPEQNVHVVQTLLAEVVCEVQPVRRRTELGRGLRRIRGVVVGHQERVGRDASVLDSTPVAGASSGDLTMKFLGGRAVVLGDEVGEDYSDRPVGKEPAMIQIERDARTKLANASGVLSCW